MAILLSGHQRAKAFTIVEFTVAIFFTVAGGYVVVKGWEWTKRHLPNSTVVSSDFSVPPTNSVVSISVASVSAFVAYETVVTAGPAHFKVINISGSSIVARFLGLPGDVTPGTVIRANSMISGVVNMALLDPGSYVAFGYYNETPAQFWQYYNIDPQRNYIGTTYDNFVYSGPKTVSQSGLNWTIGLDSKNHPWIIPGASAPITLMCVGYQNSATNTISFSIGGQTMTLTPGNGTNDDYIWYYTDDYGTSSSITQTNNDGDTMTLTTPNLQSWSAGAPPLSQAVAIERSTNMSTWTTISTETIPASQTITTTDPTAPSDRAFYRVEMLVNQ